LKSPTAIILLTILFNWSCAIKPKEVANISKKRKEIC